MTRQWYYDQNEQQIGPVAESELVDLLKAGALLEDTLIWTEGLENWTPACEYPGLLSPEAGPPPLSQNRSTLGSSDDSHYVPTGEQVRPWTRYAARTLDFILFSIICGILLAFISPQLLGLHETVLNMLLLITFVFVEAGMFALWGTTPMKALLKVRVRREDDSKLNFSDALSRGFAVWFRGMGMGIPVVSFITLVVAHGRLKKNGCTSWDDDGGYVVSHQTIGIGRSILLIFLIIFSFLLYALASAS